MEENDVGSPLLNTATEELSLRARYDMLLDHTVLLDVINHAFHHQASARIDETSWLVFEY